MAIGDRKDGRMLRDLDGMHIITPLIYPNRCDNEAFVSEQIDITNATAFLEKKNAENPEFRYTLFQLIVTAMLKTVTLRPKMNYFIANKTMYERKSISASFVIKKQFSDHGGEGLAFIKGNNDTTLETVRADMYRQITSARSGKNDKSTDAMDIVTKLPRFIYRPFVKLMCVFDRHGWVPASLIETDPYYATVVLTNLGSIGLHSGYHHLTNWGTNSCFTVVGERKKRPFYNDDGSFEMKDSIDLGLTVDERIADGYYFSKTVKLIRYLLENPEELLKPASQEVDYE